MATYDTDPLTVSQMDAKGMLMHINCWMEMLNKSERQQICLYTREQLYQTLLLLKIWTQNTLKPCQITSFPTYPGPVYCITALLLSSPALLSHVFSNVEKQHAEKG